MHIDTTNNATNYDEIERKLEQQRSIVNKYLILFILHQFVHQMRPNKSSSSSDQNPHIWLSITKYNNNNKKKKHLNNQTLYSFSHHSLSS